MIDFEELLQKNVETEYSAFKSNQVRGSTEEIFENSSKIHFYNEIQNYILNNSLNDIFSPAELTQLSRYEKHLIASLYDEYLKREHLSIANWDSIHDIIDSLLSHTAQLTTPIKTDIWEPVPNKPNCVRYVGQRKAFDVYKDVKELLEAENLMPDEYLLIGSRFEKPDIEIPKVEDVMCYAKWGGSEGVYLHVDIIVLNTTYDRYEPINFMVGKSLGETSADFDRMQHIAGRIYRAFMGDGHTSERYMKAPD